MRPPILFALGIAIFFFLPASKKPLFSQTSSVGLTQRSPLASSSSASSFSGLNQDFSTPIGVAAGVRGNVEAENPAQPARKIQSGMPLFMGDTITTDEAGGMQILLRDQTVFTIGPDSAIVMDEFVFNPETNAGKVSAKIAKGVFRFVSGKVARKNPKNMEVQLPVGNIGIRGTIAAGRVEGTKSLVVLLGPGAHNNTGDKEGSISLINEVGGKWESVELTRPGYGSTIEGPGAMPTRPELVPQEILHGLASALRPSSSSGTPGGPSAAGQAAAGDNGAAAGSEAGQDTFGALDDAGDTSDTAALSSDADESSQEAAQNATQTGRVEDGITTLDQLRTIQSGIAHFEEGTSSFTQTAGCPSTCPTPGLMDVNVTVDFGSRTFGGGASSIRICSTSSCGFIGDIDVTNPIQQVSFGSGSGQAIATDIENNMTAVMSLRNSGGIVAKIGEVDVTFDNGPDEGNGRATAERQAGAAG